MSSETSVTERLRTSRKREEGQTMTEYSVVLSVITIGIVTAFAAFSGGIQGAINRATKLIGLIPI